jgi:hypothetical protein
MGGGAGGAAAALPPHAAPPAALGVVVEGVDDLGVGWGVGFADAQVDEREVGVVLDSEEFGLFNFFEFVGGVVCREGRAADSICE